MEGISKRIEVIANLAIIFVALLLGTILIKRYLFQSTDPPDEIAKSSSQLIKNQKLDIAGVDWSKSDKTLVLAISSSCHFCTDSAPFYQQIAKSHPKTRLLAVLLQPLSEGRRYVTSLGIKVDDVLQAPLDSIKVAGTPTLILVSSEGTVVDSWIGKLSAEREKLVLDEVNN